VVPSAAALAVPVERGQERGQSGGTGSDYFGIKAFHYLHPFQVRLGVEDDGVSSRHGAADLVISFQSATLVKTRGCGGSSQWEGSVERNLGLVASTWPQACT
jgi:hypothetical protein